ncbi:MAG: SPFH domain-containing protein, partial [Dehalococcoidales bacterium]
IREVVSDHMAADIYGEGRATVEVEIFDKLASTLEPRHIYVEQILLREVELPSEITKAIESKKQAEQEALRMQYVLQKEGLEKERKLIEADGIAGANKIIADSLSREYLAWYWIDNLDNHDSVVYMVPSESGVPLFKDIDSIITDGDTPNAEEESNILPETESAGETLNEGNSSNSE